MDSLSIGDLAISTISGETVRIVLVAKPHVLVRYKANPGRVMLRFLKDFKPKKGVDIS